jgi:hypothetical protein
MTPRIGIGDYTIFNEKRAMCPGFAYLPCTIREFVIFLVMFDARFAVAITFAISFWTGAIRS